MKRNILLPTDFSDNAWSAAVYALKLYAKEDCEFYFLHASNVKGSSMANITNKLSRVMAEKAMKDLGELKQMVENTNASANHDFNVLLSSKDLDDAIDASVKKYNIDLVVMGTKGATGAKEIFIGSNTVHIIKKIKDCPILIVPDEFNFVVPKQIAFPTDFNRFYGEELLPLKRISELYNSKIRIVHINEKDRLSEVQNYNLAMLKAYLEDYSHSFHWMPDYDKKAEGINDFIKELDINILTIINYEHSFIERIVNEPVVKKISNHLVIPFLVIPCAS